MRGRRGFASDERAQSLVEVALALPILLLLVLGVVDIGRVYAYKIATTNAAREAAIFAARDPQARTGGPSGICQRARDELGAGPTANACTTAPITVTCSRDGIACGDATAFPVLYQTAGAGGAAVTVTVTYQVELVSTYLVAAAIRTNPLDISSSAFLPGLGE